MSVHSNLVPTDPERTTPDPVYAHQARQLGRPDLADPVIRHHLNLPPLPDPYEKARQRAEYWQKERHKHVLP